MKRGWFFFRKLYVKLLYLEKINIHLIEDNALNLLSFSTLEYLFIKDVPLLYLKKKTFMGLKSLKTLSLSGLRLIVVHEDVLAPIKSLNMFVLNGCGEEKIYLDKFFGHTNMFLLKTVFVSNCILDNTITASTFTGLPSISLLSLSLNSIHEIGRSSFDKVLETLDLFYLKSNKLAWVPENIFQTTRNVSIDLGSNEWHCDCRMEHLRLFAKTTIHANFSGLICNTPQKYHGVDLKDCPPLCEDATHIISDSMTTTPNSLEEQKPTEIVKQRVTDIEEKEKQKLSFKDVQAFFALVVPTLPSTLEPKESTDESIEQLNESTVSTHSSFIQEAESHSSPPQMVAFDQEETTTNSPEAKTNANEMEHSSTESTFVSTQGTSELSLISSTHKSTESTTSDSFLFVVDTKIDEDNLIIIYVLSGILAVSVVFLILIASIKLGLLKI